MGLGGNDSIDGGAGNDTIIDGVGADTMYGGTGAGDWVSYAGSTGVIVDLSSTVAQSGGDAAGGILGGFENLIGSDNADSLSGTAGANTIYGGAGIDTIRGGAGADNSLLAADRLDEAGIAFIFLSGHSADFLPERHRHRPLVAKPFHPRLLLQAILDARAGAKA